MVIAADTCPSACVPEDRRVCAVDETGKRREFRNACEAAVGGARVLHPGRCVYQRVCAVEGVRVCAIDVRTGKEVTYANLCEAEAANADYRHRGKCGARWRTLLKRLNPDGQR
jgi:hypothetical protein